MATRPECACFGIEWDPKAAECAGGVEYLRGGERRKPCDYFTDGSCQNELTARRRLPLIPTASLTRPPAMAGASPLPVRVAPSWTGGTSMLGPPMPPAPPQYPGISSLAQRLAQPPATATYRPQAVQMQQALAVAPSALPTVSYIAQDTHMPGYLHVPEVQQPGESIFAPLFRELIRGAMKGLLHTGAAFVDNHVFGRRQEDGR